MMSWGIAAKLRSPLCTARRLPPAFKQGSANVLHIPDNGDVTVVREYACWKPTMKTLMTGALTALLMATAAAPALAQQGGYPDGDPRNSGGRARWGAAVNRNPEHQAPQQQQQPQAAPSEQRHGGGRDWNRGDDGRRGGGDHRRGDDHGRGDRGPDHRGDGRSDGRGDRDWDRNRGGDANRNWDRNRNWDNERGRDRAWRERGRDWDRDRPRYDRRHYPSVYRSPRRYRGPVWTPPIGFYSRSWVFGDTLPRGWYGSNYRIDWWSYGLPIPPVGYEWVRIGDDAVLVDEFTGRIVQVVPNLFW
jgi:Ni/Co efflux regulator RcnB